ncbi:MAG TPA: NrtA/SsuA/CpmA family ABC transporter substrate-binding protein [Amycolatopsis sp.]|nr:NrtA/SsuA/CpmA family ABC transporter substrate-binding protein [Amycolatopsis sp.]
MFRGPLRAAGRALAGLAAALLVAGCGLLGAEPEPTPGPQPTLRVTAMPLLDIVPLHLAINHGFFTTEGVVVDPVDTGSGQAAIAKLTSGEVHVAYAGDVAIVNAVAAGITLRIIAEAAAAGERSMMIMVRGDNTVPAVPALAGKKIAHNGEGGVSDLLTRSLLADHKVDVSTIQWTTLQFPEMAAALNSRTIDAALLPEPLASRAAMQGLKPLVDPATGGALGIPTGSYVVEEDWAKKNPFAVGAFQRAMQKASIEATSNRGLVEQVAVEKMDIAADVAAIANFPTFRSKPSLPELRRVPTLINTYSTRKVNVDMDALVLPFPGS